MQDGVLPAERHTWPQPSAAPDACERAWLRLEEGSDPGPRLVLATYNLLCPPYALPRHYHGIPAASLQWSARWRCLEAELRRVRPDEKHPARSGRERIPRAHRLQLHDQVRNRGPPDERQR